MRTLTICAMLLIAGCATDRNARIPAGYGRAVTKLNAAGQQDLRAARETIREAIKELRAVIDESPNFAPALALLAEARLMDDIQNREARHDARKLAERALAISPRQARAHAVLGWLRFFEDYRYAEALTHFERALAGEPADEFARYG